MGCFHGIEIRVGAAVIAAAIFAGCEPDDPQVRKELVELRTEVASAKKELESLRSELAVVSKKAQQTDFLSAEQLSGGVERLREQMRKSVGDAFPGYELVSLSPGSVETPITTEYPYAVGVTFFLKEGNSGTEHGPYFLVLKADRSGSWQLPTPEEIASRLGAGQATASQESSTTQQLPGQDQGDTRVIEWRDGNQQTAPSPPRSNGGAGRPPESAERGRPPLPSSGPEGGIPSANPMPGAQETRSIEW